MATFISDRQSNADACGQPAIGTVRSMDLGSGSKDRIGGFARGQSSAPIQNVVRELLFEPMTCDVIMYRACRFCIVSGGSAQQCKDLAESAMNACMPARSTPESLEKLVTGSHIPQSDQIASYARVIDGPQEVRRAGPGVKSPVVVAELYNLTPGAQLRFVLDFRAVLPFSNSVGKKAFAALRLCWYTGQERDVDKIGCMPDHEQREMAMHNGNNSISSVIFTIPEATSRQWVLIYVLGEHSELMHFTMKAKLVDLQSH